MASASRRQSTDTGGVETDLPQPTSLDAGVVPDFNERAATQCHLAAIEVTDVLVLGLDPAALAVGTTLSPARASTRAAWYSLAFVLRAAGAQLLDIDHKELQAGIRSIRHEASDVEPVGQVFLGDALANGAGYATYLGRDDVVPQLLSTARDMVTGWSDETSHRCDSACYDCLRDYWNIPFHGLLDWRLAGVFLDLMMDGSFSRATRWQDLERAALEDMREAFPFEPEKFGDRSCLVSGDRVLIPRHPLEQPGLDHLSVELADVVARIAEKGYSILER